jgi:glycosyltransferase involved in cell wall biosynthesis
MKIDFPSHTFYPSTRSLCNSKDLPLFSIIITTYNRATYLAETIESVLKQSYSNIEIIIVDHKALDLNKEIYSKFISENDNISLVKFDENHGIYKVISYCWNAGLKYSKGEFIAVLNDDDYVSNNYVEKMVNLFLENPKCITAAPQPVSVDQGLNTKTELINTRDRFMSGFELAKNLLSGNKNSLITATGGIMCYRKSSLFKTGGFDTIADWSQIFKHSVLGDTGYDSDAKLYWRHHAEQSNRVMQDQGDVFYSFQMKGIKDSQVIELWREHFSVEDALMLEQYFMNCLNNDVKGVLQRQLRRRKFVSVPRILYNTYLECPHLLPKQIVVMFKFVPWAVRELIQKLFLKLLGKS